jgi:hypothetical protein
MRHKLSLLLFLVVFNLYAQEDAGSAAVMKQVLERLDTLEKENKELVEEIRALRQQLAESHPAPAAAPMAAEPGEPPLDERLSVEEQRTAEQAQTKVEAAHKFPIQLGGMLLFNVFANSSNAAAEYADNYNLLAGPSAIGATVRQTLLDLNFQGPHLPGDGTIKGFVSMDFYGGSSDPEYIRFRLRRAGVSFDWKKRSFFVGQDKPLISPYQPDSFAEVGVPPLAGAGNLWLWLPQARYEERFNFGTNTGFTGQVALLQTEESYAAVPSSLASTLEQARPALEGRFAFWHKFDDTRRFEFAPGFHTSTTHVAGTSIDSHIGSFDWLMVPASHLQFSGTFFNGQNIASLGALGSGFAIAQDGTPRPVHSTGGWAQLTVPITNRLTFHVFSGVEDDRNQFLYATSIVHNWTYASNLVYRLGPNVIISLEALQMRTRSAADVGALQNHYDLAIGYLF